MSQSFVTVIVVLLCSWALARDTIIIKSFGSCRQGKGNVLKSPYEAKTNVTRTAATSDSINL